MAHTKPKHKPTHISNTTQNWVTVVQWYNINTSSNIPLLNSGWVTESNLLKHPEFILKRSKSGWRQGLGKISAHWSWVETWQISRLLLIIFSQTKKISSSMCLVCEWLQDCGTGALLWDCHSGSEVSWICNAALLARIEATEFLIQHLLNSYIQPQHWIEPLNCVSLPTKRQDLRQEHLSINSCETAWSIISLMLTHAESAL